MAAKNTGLVPLEEIRDTPLTIEVAGLRKLTFAPNPDHEDRHIEWVPPLVAQDLMHRHNGRFQKLAIANDLIYGDLSANQPIDPIRQAVSVVMDEQEIEDLVLEKVKARLAAGEKKQTKAEARAEAKEEAEERAEAKADAAEEKAEAKEEAAEKKAAAKKKAAKG